MWVTTIACKTTAPLFMGGAEKNAIAAINRNGKQQTQPKPELRAASIKGVMRYFWRAIQCEENMADLRKREGALFGNANDNACACPWKLQICEPIDEQDPSQHNLLPYRDENKTGGKLPTYAFSPNKTFCVRIIGGKDDKQHLDIVRLFVLTCMLGGFGRRSRKGMGTLKILDISGYGENINKDGNLNNCHSILKELAGSVRYTINKEETHIKSNANIKKKRYPYVESITLYANPKAKTADKLQYIIGDEVHKNREDRQTDEFLGFAGSQGRFASSLILSTVENGDVTQCIVTQLYCTKNPSNRDVFLNKLRTEVEE